MRLDKYLKVSRLIKRRTVANDACDAGRVMINDKVAKASVDVKLGDIIEIQFGTKSVKVKVTDIKETTKKDEAKEMFEYLQNTGIRSAGRRIKRSGQTIYFIDSVYRISLSAKMTGSSVRIKA